MEPLEGFKREGRHYDSQFTGTLAPLLKMGCGKGGGAGQEARI